MRVTETTVIVDAFGTVPEALKKDRENWKSEEELKPSSLQHCWDQPG